MSRADTRYIVFDTESVPDGALISKTLHAGEGLSPEESIERLREERLRQTDGASDFIPVSFQIPVAVCVARVGEDFRLLDLVALAAPEYDPRQMVSLFWKGVDLYKNAILVDFNGRGFDIPLLTLAAFRFGISCPNYFGDPDRFGHRYRFTSKHIDLLEWMTEYGATRLKGGLDLCAKILGKPGKLGTSGGDVGKLFDDGKIQEINEYCLQDVLDTYFVFLRTRVLTGELTLEREQEIVAHAREWIESKSEEQPSLRTYLESFGEWDPVPFR